MTFDEFTEGMLKVTAGLAVIFLILAKFYFFAAVLLLVAVAVSDVLEEGEDE